MSQEIIEQIKNNPFGEIDESIFIDNQEYQITYQWKRRISISIRRKQSLITDTAVFEIRKLPIMSMIVRSPQYSLRGEKTELTEKLLLNQYTRALLYFPTSKISCQNHQISYTAKLRRKDSDQLETIIEHFRALLTTL
ncbi:hypothetical protein [Aequorivita lipolytica]|uniref:Uncharacterized protein n=1 Tax=Aequorivita lipolytica TaxID=153267 RepID=A0A5C6YN67_9FLAO|nr:hypothetical protein [Aequorivita lipolytica]TXD68312.1 hypothetical protein ESV24_12665 [Aequorivita lipolytica]SRX53418.1 hypothetical protein AEQU2_02648 [Aequorivita lipolytica]